tara:strand:- start:1451 stop:2305 length:855 start_codon:yes stop_codon:yes gene_type:complete
MRICFLLIVFSFTQLNAQTDSTKAFRIAVASELIVYSATLYGLNDLWYSDYERSSFHWYNDNKNWYKQDKFGHATTAYNVSQLGTNVMLWSGVPRKKAIWYGGLYGPFFLTSIEILDGYSEKWGASYGDLIANTLGSFLFVGQELAWQEQKIQLKYSFYQTSYASQNPNILGSNFMEEAIKDYNGQTYWLSLNLKSFISKSKTPEYLNVAFGYGIDNLLSGGAFTDDSKQQYYLSLDIDLNRIKTNNAFLDKCLKVLSFIKVPMPAIILDSKQKFKFYPIYYGQ